jgi:hypothetical protein
MIKTVVALMMFMVVNGEFELKEHYYVAEGMATCLKMKREGERNSNPQKVKYMCGNVNAEMSKDGKHIVSIRSK